MPKKSTSANSSLSDSDIELVRSFLDRKLTPVVKAIPKDKIFDALSDKLSSPFQKETFKLALASAMKQGHLSDFEGKVGKSGGIGRKAEAPRKSKPVEVKIILQNEGEMKQIADKARETGCPSIHPTEGLKCLHEKDHANPHQNEFITWNDDSAFSKPAPQVKELLDKMEEEWGGPQTEEELTVTTLPASAEEQKEEAPLPPPPKRPEFTPSWTKPSPAPSTKQTLLLKGKRLDVPVSWAKANDLILRVFELEEDPNGEVEFDGRHYNCPSDKLQLLDNMIFYFFDGHVVIADATSRP